MGIGVEETKYEPEVRERNRRAIAVVTVAAVAMVLLIPTYTDWAFTNAMGIAAIILVIQTGTWWMFASKNAGYLRPSSAWPDWRKRLGL